MISKLMSAFDAPGPWLDWVCIIVLVLAAASLLALSYRTCGRFQ